MAAAKVSPLAPKTFAELPPIDGVRLAAGAAGIRYKGRTDVMLAVFEKARRSRAFSPPPNALRAPVDWCRDEAARAARPARWWSIPATPTPLPARRREAAELTAKLAAKAVGADEDEIFLASTGVIGEPLDARNSTACWTNWRRRRAPTAGSTPPRAIMTTDTFPKVATAKAKIGDVEVTINGMAKGAGMIAPDMATMLSYVFTDAAISRRSPAEAAVQGREGHVQCDDGRQRHLDLRHLDALRHRRGGKARPEKGQEGRAASA